MGLYQVPTRLGMDAGCGKSTWVVGRLSRGRDSQIPELAKLTNNKNMAPCSAKHSVCIFAISHNDTAVLTQFHDGDNWQYPGS